MVTVAVNAFIKKNKKQIQNTRRYQGGETGVWSGVEQTANKKSRQNHN